MEFGDIVDVSDVSILNNNIIYWNCLLFGFFFDCCKIECFLLYLILFIILLYDWCIM